MNLADFADRLHTLIEIKVGDRGDFSPFDRALKHLAEDAKRAHEQLATKIGDAVRGAPAGSLISAGAPVYVDIPKALAAFRDQVQANSVGLVPQPRTIDADDLGGVLVGPLVEELAEEKRTASATPPKIDLSSIEVTRTLPGHKVPEDLIRERRGRVYLVPDRQAAVLPSRDYSPAAIRACPALADLPEGSVIAFIEKSPIDRHVRVTAYHASFAAIPPGEPLPIVGLTKAINGLGPAHPCE